MAFEITSVHLEIELGRILAFVIGWQSTIAEFFSGPFMIILIALSFRPWICRKIVDAAR
jgi:hypothetical protein